VEKKYGIVATATNFIKKKLPNDLKNLSIEKIYEQEK